MDWFSYQGFGMYIYIYIYIIIHEICSLDSIIKTHIDILHGLHEGKVIIPQRE